MQLDNDWTWNSFATWGETDSEQRRQDGLVRERAALALDVTYDGQGKMICVNETAREEGCVPFDIFGANTITPQVIDYLSVPQSLDSNVQQTVIGTHLSGDTDWELDAGPVAFSAGLEYREC